MAAVNYAVYLLEEAGVVTTAESREWRKVLEGVRGLDRDRFSMSVAHLDLVEENYRRDCFLALGFSPRLSDFVKWLGENRGFIYERASTCAWVANRETGYAYGPGDFLYLAGRWLSASAADLHLYANTHQRVGPEEYACLTLSDEASAVEMARVDVVEPEAVVVEGESAGLVDVSEVVEDHEDVYDTPLALLFREVCRSSVSKVLGLTPTLLEVFSCTLPMVNFDDLSRIYLDYEDGKFQIGRFFGERTEMDVLSVLRVVCRDNPGVARVRQEVDSVSYLDRACDIVRDFEVLGEAWKGLVCDDLLTDAAQTSSVIVCGDDAMVEVRENPVYAAVAPGDIGRLLVDVLGSRPSVLDLLNVLGGRFREWDDGSGDRSSASYGRTYVRFRGTGTDKLLDGVWCDGSIPPSFGYSRVYRRMRLGSQYRVGMRRLVSCRYVGYDEVPKLALLTRGRSDHGCTFLELVYELDVGPDSDSGSSDTFVGEFQADVLPKSCVKERDSGCFDVTELRSCVLELE